MINTFLFGIFFWLATLGCGSLPAPSSQLPVESRPDHGLWETVLQKHVDESGNVDYQNLKNQPGAFLAYLNHLSKSSPAADWSRADSLAYFINLYNAATIKLILEHYPVSSIKDISSPWSTDFVVIGDEKVSLGYIEHRVLRNMDEPRIHFAINCASYSCPRLWNKAFTPDQIEVQLESLTEGFIKDPRHNSYDEDTWVLSKIFNWYKRDFKTEGGVVNYIARYTGLKPGPEQKITYQKYDWNLNEAQK